MRFLHKVNRINNDIYLWEILINEYMTKLEDLSKGRYAKNIPLHNTSVLDIPAFGSIVTNLKELHKDAPNWPIEVNFAISQKYIGG